MDNKSNCDEEISNSKLNYFTKTGETSIVHAVISQVHYTKHLGELDQNVAFENLKNVALKVKNGNLEYVESVLLNQAHTLDAIFNNLACRAASREWINHFETCMRLALKAQSQCRATLEALANIKNPVQIAFVKQANIGHNQQVNNGVLPSVTPIPPEEIKNPQNQLLEADHGERLDTRKKSTPGRVDKELAPVGKVNGA